jgi:hypothetical protein
MQELTAAASCATTEANPIISGLLIGLSLLFITLALAISCCFKVLGANNNRHDVYQNGVSVSFAIRLALMGPGFQSLMKITAESSRRRLFTGMRRFVFFGREIWMAGHPAMCKHIFTPAHHRLFTKIEKDALANLMFQGGGEPNLASKSLCGETNLTDLSNNGCCISPYPTCAFTYVSFTNFMQCSTPVMMSAGNMLVKSGAHSL